MEKVNQGVRLPGRVFNRFQPGISLIRQRRLWLSFLHRIEYEMVLQLI
jgi:hypothetical protein